MVPVVPAPQSPRLLQTLLAKGLRPGCTAAARGGGGGVPKIGDPNIRKVTDDGIFGMQRFGLLQVVE